METLPCRDSSSSASASCTTGPGTETAGRATYSHPVAARRTPTASMLAVALRAALRMSKPLSGNEIGGPCVVPPERPVVTAVHLEVAVGDSRSRELTGERGVLLVQRIRRARVEPEVRTELPQRRRDPWKQETGIVRGERPQVRPEDRADLVGPLVARPRFDDGELARMVERECRSRRSRPRTNRRSRDLDATRSCDSASRPRARDRGRRTSPTRSRRELRRPTPRR